MSCKMPWVYSSDNPNGRTLHDDWPWPLSLIPRRWTGHCFPMPPKQIAGNAPVFDHVMQEDYPIAAPVTPHVYARSMSVTYVDSPDPVPPIGCWTVQAVWTGWFWIPCYFAFSVMLFGRRLHMNGPLKPDLTLGDWFWWFECSLSWTKVNA